MAWNFDSRPGGQSGAVNQAPIRSANPGNPYLPFLEDQPEAMYRSLVNQWNRGVPIGFSNRASNPQFKGSNNFLNYWTRNYGNVRSDYTGAVADMARAGQTPNLSFADYLSKYNFLDKWNQLAPWDRGDRGARRGIWNLGY